MTPASNRTPRTREGEAPAEPRPGAGVAPETDRPSRRHPTHGVFLTPDGPTIVFLTLCTRGRRRWLKSHRAHRIVRDVLKSATAWRAGDYLLMPDHMHLFVSPSDESITLQAWVRYLKSMVSKACANPRWRFQADYWDTRMRTVEQYEEKWRYVRMNPVRAGLADRPEAWPFQGRIEVAYW